MNRMLLALLLSVCLCSRASAAGDLDGFLSNLNVQARLDQNGFSARVSAQFGVPEARVQMVLGSVSEPADAFMVFQLGQMTHQPPEKVMAVYKAHKGKGWGVIAKELGIKPGSLEFQALKRGDFHLGAKPDKDVDKEKGKGKGRGKSGKEN